ncbi:hypothetical protein AB0M43_39070 [Longispora sp. NPDC051575]
MSKKFVVVDYVTGKGTPATTTVTPAQLDALTRSGRLLANHGDGKPTTHK